MVSIFPPASVQHEVEKKGFFVYPYISLKELSLTVQQDYLAIIEKINIPFAIIFVLVGYFSFKSENFGFLSVLLMSTYSIIFVVLMSKLLFRTKKFLQSRNVVFTEKGFLMHGNFFSFSESEKIDEVLEIYEKEFQERLLQPSTLKGVIFEKRKKIFDGVKMLAEKALQAQKSIDRNNSFFLFGLVLLGIYAVSLFVFYYAGILLGGIFFAVYFVLLKIFLLFQKPLELEMKEKMEMLEMSLESMKKEKESLVSTLSTFVEGNVSNMEKQVGNSFLVFYQNIADIVKTEKNLMEKIEKSIYHDFFNTQIFRAYVKKKFNEPVQNMLLVLEKSQNDVQKQKEEVNALILENPAPEFLANLKLKKQNLERMEKILQQQQEKFLALQL